MTTNDKARLHARMRRIAPNFNPMPKVSDFLAHFVIGAAIAIVMCALLWVIGNELRGDGFDRAGLRKLIHESAEPFGSRDR